MSFKEGTDKI